VLHLYDEWVVYFDRYRDHRYGAIASSDLAKWEDVSALLAMPDGMRHGTAFAVPRVDADRLLSYERGMTP